MIEQKSSVFLWDVHAGVEVDAELVDGINDKHLDAVEATWEPARVDALYRLKSKGIPPAKWPQSLHWNWRRKHQSTRGFLAYRGFCILCRNHVQGLMLVKTTQLCQLQSQKGKPQIYIDYLESAPWNQNGFAEHPCFRGVGTVMLAAAVQLSLDEGFHGRVGLHSLPQSESFYLRHGMETLGSDSTKQGLVYFELTPDKASDFIR